MLVNRVSLHGDAIVFWGTPPTDQVPWFPTQRLVLNRYAISSYFVHTQRGIELFPARRQAIAVTIDVFCHGFDRPHTLSIPTAAVGEDAWEPINIELVSNVLAALDAAVANRAMPGQLEPQEPF